MSIETNRGTRAETNNTSAIQGRTTVPVGGTGIEMNNPSEIFERLEARQAISREESVAIFGEIQPCLTLPQNAAKKQDVDELLLEEIRNLLREKFGSPEEFLAIEIH